MNRHRALVALALAALGAACSKEPSSPSSDAAKPSPFALAADPAGGMSVVQAIAAAPKDDVVVEGRVRDVTAGLAAFTLIDVSLTYCGQNKMEGCPHPWDYCCYPPGKIRENLIGVEAKGKDGNVVALPRLPELRNLDRVAVKGRLTKGANGGVVLEATGWFRRERPNLADGLEWPQ